jgi:phosphoserine phosphatase
MTERPYDLVCFDLDGTLIQGTVFIWQTLHDAFHTDAEQRRLAKEAFFAGQLTYQEWFRHDLVLLGQAGATRERMIAAMSGIHVTPGAREVLRALRAAGCRLAILSGSLDLVLEHFLGDERFDEVLINRIGFDAEGRLATGVHTPYDVDLKGEGLREIGRRLGVTPDRTAFVGDNANDLSAAEAAGFAIAFNPRSDALAAVASVVVKSTDLRPILPYLLGSAV